MKRHIIIGTAGHIDHGKTALIKALTNIDTDVLRAEKERGITIELGFAYWKDNITIIDVPGHERFIKTMVAGVSTIDLFLLVIAADDGIMPQTVEHFEILKFFGVKNGLVALNKIDLVDQEWIDLMQMEIKEFLTKHGYSDIPIIPVSATTGQGLEQLRQVLAQKITSCSERLNNQPFRLNIDRAFSIHGAGTVVTGTVLSDSIAIEDTISILPSKKPAKVRALQVHQKEVNKAFIGERVAINLAGIEKSEVERGKVLIKPGTLEPTREFLAIIQTSSQVPVKIRKHQEVRIYLGTAEILGRITWFEEQPMLLPNNIYHVRLRLEKDGVCAPGDAVLIRTISPFYTVAGGRVLFLDPPPLGQLKPQWQTYFNLLSSLKLTKQLEFYFQFTGFKAISLNQLQKQFFEKSETLRRQMEALTKAGKVLLIEHQKQHFYIALSALENAQNQLLEAIKSAVQKSNLVTGFNKNELQSFLHPPCKDKIFFSRLLQRMLNRKLLQQVDDLFLLPEMLQLEERQKMISEVLQALKDRGFQALKMEEIAQKLNLEIEQLKGILPNLVRQGEVHSLAGTYYLHNAAFQKIINFLKQQFNEKTTLEITSLKEFTGLTRKILIPLLEYLDQKQFTLRKGDVRIKGPMLN